MTSTMMPLPVSLDQDVDLLVTKPTASIVMVTPEMAKRWLERNEGNRTLRWNLVESYAHDMRAGRWVYAGEAIKFGANGDLWDGQHRLRAQVLSGVTLPMLVVRGLQVGSQQVMDTGAKRTAADALKMERGSKAVAAAAGARQAILMALGNVQTRSRPVISNAEIISWIDDNPSFVDALPLATAHQRHIPVSTGVLTLIAWRLRDIDAVAAASFLSQVAIPDAIPRDDPRAVLNRRLGDMKDKRVKESPAFYLDLFFQAWNRWRRGEAAALLRVTRTPRGRINIAEPK